MAGGYLGNVYNEYATGSNLMNVDASLIGGQISNNKEDFSNNTNLADLFGMLGILIVLAVILVLGYKFFSHKRKH